MPRYCITHDVTMQEVSVPGDECLIVYSPVPDLDTSDEWVESLVPPTEEELIEMDMNAEVLEADFEK